MDAQIGQNLQLNEFSTILHLMGRCTFQGGKRRTLRITKQPIAF